MKKNLVSLLLPAFFAGILWAANANALVYEGNPDQNENHFVWDLMAQMQTPDDPDCPTLAGAALDVDGTVPQDQRSTISTAACQGLASMRTSMQTEIGAGQGGESVSTNLFSSTNWHAVENLYFEHSINGVADGKIAFSKPIDFMSYDFMNFMTNFGENMEAEQGYISLDADTVGGFANYGASLTMYNVPDFENPAILVDGEEDNGNVVSNITYNRENNTLVFSAAHFTSFEAVEASTVGSPKITNVKYEKYLSSTGKERIKVTVRGKRFKNNAEVKFGSKRAFRVKKSSSRKLTAYFSTSDLRRLGHKKLRISVENPNGNSDSFNSKKSLNDIK